MAVAMRPLDHIRTLVIFASSSHATASSIDEEPFGGTIGRSNKRPARPQQEIVRSVRTAASAGPPMLNSMVDIRQAGTYSQPHG